MNITHLRIASDLHLEAFTGRAAETLRIDFLGSFDDDHEALLILAGDISSKSEQLIEFLAACCNRYAQVLFVPGNHEYYRHDFAGWNASMREELKSLSSKLIFTTDSLGFHQVGDLQFVFGTLWGDGGKTKYDREAVSWSLNDFRLIRTGGHQRAFSVADMMQLNHEHVQGIGKILEGLDRSKKTIVVTHHLPSRKLVSDRFWPGNGDDGINGGFACDADHLFDLEPTLWIHGHTHDTIDRTIQSTRVVCNPAGYRGEWRSPFNTYFEHDADGHMIGVNPKRILVSEL